jgi:hypothetical protein
MRVGMAVHAERTDEARKEVAVSVLERAGTGGPSSPEEPPRGTPSRGRWPASRRIALAIAAIAVIAAAVAVVALTSGDDGEQAQTSTSTTVAPATTIGPSTTASPPTSVPADTATAVYPSAGATVHYSNPVDAARGFAIDFVGFVDPVVGEFQQGDSQSGEVEVRPSAMGPVTTVLVRRLGTSWWVLGAATPNIELREPVALATISSPVRLAGVSTAFEANVSVEIRQDGARRPLGEGFVMGGSMGELGPFNGTVEFADPSAPMGAIVLYTASMENGEVWEASVLRVGLAARSALVPASTCPDYSMVRPEPANGQRVITVFFSCGPEASPVPSYRLAPATTGVLRAALDAALAGPTAAEAEAGLESWFSAATATMLANVVVQDGRAVVDFHDLRQVIPNASSSAGSRQLLSQLDATVFQFPTVSSVVYRIEGDCEAFNEWLQFGGCAPRTRSS